MILSVPEWVSKYDFHLKMWKDEPLVKSIRRKEDDSGRGGREYAAWICLTEDKF
jgi:hypothetical protein